MYMGVETSRDHFTFRGNRLNARGTVTRFFLLSLALADERFNNLLFKKNILCKRYNMIEKYHQSKVKL